MVADYVHSPGYLGNRLNVYGNDGICGDEWSNRHIYGHIHCNRTGYMLLHWPAYMGLG